MESFTAQEIRDLHTAALAQYNRWSGTEAQSRADEYLALAEKLTDILGPERSKLGGNGLAWGGKDDSQGDQREQSSSTPAGES